MNHEPVLLLCCVLNCSESQPPYYIHKIDLMSLEYRETDIQYIYCTVHYFIDSQEACCEVRS